MPIQPIRPFGDPVLRQPARAVERIDKAVRRLIDDMIETMRQADGVGLAAPQVGIAQRLFVAEVDDQTYIFVNPEIEAASDEREIAEEGCLSLPGLRGEVERHARVTVRGKDRRGKEHTVAAEGLLARCIQHEIDHLDGVLYTDRMAPGAPLRAIDDDEEAGQEGTEVAQAG